MKRFLSIACMLALAGPAARERAFAGSGAATALAEDVQVSASVDSQVIGLDETVDLTVTVSGSDSGSAGTPQTPRLRGFRVVSGPSVSTQFQWINGRSSQSKSFTWTLLPEREGEIEIESIEVPVGGRSYRTQILSVRVVRGPARAAPPRRRAFDPFGADPFGRPRAPRTDGEVSMTAEVDRTDVYVGQQVTLTYHLDSQIAVTGLQLQESPALTGFWVEELDVEKSPTGTRRILDGKDYLDYVVKRQALFPNTAGRLRIPPATFAVSVKTAGDFFGILGQPETVFRRTRELVLDVRPLPEAGRPAAFGNAVGSFTLESSLDRSTAAAGEPVSLRVKLSGRGNLKVIGDLELPPMPEFTIYSSRRADNVRPADGGQIAGEKSWEYVIVPKAPGKQTVPSLAFAYFDPERERYETLATRPLELEVTRGKEPGLVTGLSGAGKQPLARQRSDVHFIKLSAGDLDAAAPSSGRILWFGLAAVLALAFNVGAAVYSRERERDRADAVGVRRRRARRTAMARLRAAEKAGRAEPRRFYDEAALALSSYLSDRFALPEIALTADTLSRELASRGVDPALIAETAALVSECDFGRFVSASADVEKRRALAGRLRDLIGRLENS